MVSMVINGKIFSIAFLFNILSPFLVYSSDLGIRGFVMGERYAAVLKAEQSLGEFALQNGANGSRLVYKGSVLGESAVIVYSFRAKRLVSLCYVWAFPSSHPFFSDALTNLLGRKYQASAYKRLPVPAGSAEYFLYADKKDPPSLLAELEIFRPESGDQTVILEFRAPDSDATLIKKILAEDI